MSSNLRVLMDPTSERHAPHRERQPRLDKLDGKTIGLLDISKPRGDVFLDRVAERLGEHGVTVKRYMKPTFTRVAPGELKQQIASEVDAVVEGLAD